MELLGEYNMKDSLKLVVLLKFFTFMFFVWNPKNDVCRLSKDLEMKFKQYRSSNKCFNRLLKKDEYKEELDDLKLGGNLLDYEMPPNVNNEGDVTSTYEYIKKRNPINLLSYKKDYEHIYSKKKGLAKLDCYYEKKIFDKIDHIYVLAKSMRNDKKLLRKELNNKFNFRIILFSLIPVLGLIVPFALYGYFATKFTCFEDCLDKSHQSSGTHDDKKYFKAPLNKSTSETISTVNLVLYCILSFMVLAVFIYIWIKFIKYQRIKACRSKMSIKEYCKFCKSFYI